MGSLGKRKPPLYTTPLGIQVVSENTYKAKNGKPYVICHVRPHPMVTSPLIYRSRLKMTEKLGRKLKSSEIVHHKDEDLTTDDRLSNLEIMTRGKHAIVHRAGTKHSERTLRKMSAAKVTAHQRGDYQNANPKNEASPHAKLTWAKVREMRALFAAGHTNKELSEKFSVAPSRVSTITHNKAWREE